MPGTPDDAKLMVELAKWGAMMELGPATGALFSDEFDSETATLGDVAVRTAATFFETVGTLVKNGLFDRELALDWLWVGGVWRQVAPAIERVRADQGEPRLYENFEALAQAQSG